MAEKPKVIVAPITALSRVNGKNFKKGGAVKASKSVSSASKRADGIATKGKTRGKMV